MHPAKPVYVLGCGAVGFPLAAHLARTGRKVVAVRTRRNDIPEGEVPVAVRNDAGSFIATVQTVSLSNLSTLDGTIVIAAKSYANEEIAQDLGSKDITGPVVLLQNGVGVERAFLVRPFPGIYRCVLYVTGQTAAEREFMFRPICPSPIGIVRGTRTGLQSCVEDLTTEGFPFRSETNIQREIWKKAILNSVFNSICPLLEVDNGIFARSKEAATLAREVVQECLELTDRLGLDLTEKELMDQAMRISEGSTGQLISTLQDIRTGRPTEIEFLNLEMSRVAASLEPSLQLPKTELLGKMILAKSSGNRRGPEGF